MNKLGMLILSIVLVGTALFIKVKPAETAEIETGTVLSPIKYDPVEPIHQWPDGNPFVLPDCITRTYTVYTNLTELEVRLYAIKLWIGLYKDSYADVTLELYRVSVDGNTTFLDFIPTDRYANPSAPHSQYTLFAPAYISIGAGEKIVMNGLNCPVGDSNPSPMHPTVILYLSSH